MPSRIEDNIPVRTLHQYFTYCRETGTLFFNFRPGITQGEQMFNTRYAGKPAKGSPNSNGHINVGLSIDGTRYLILYHRIVYAMHTGSWPDGILDHRDTNKTNNKFSNLRIASDSKNRMNTGIRADNKCGLKGVSRHSQSGKYVAQIGHGVDKPRLYLGVFEDPIEAARAYDAAALALHGEFARTNAAMGLI